MRRGRSQAPSDPIPTDRIRSGLDVHGQAGQISSDIAHTEPCHLQGSMFSGVANAWINVPDRGFVMDVATLIRLTDDQLGGDRLRGVSARLMTAYLTIVRSDMTGSVFAMNRLDLIQAVTTLCEQRIAWPG